MILVIGSGGHAKVVLDALLASGTRTADIALCDEDEARVGRQVLGFTVQPLDLGAGRRAQVAIGGAAARERLYAACAEAGIAPLTVHHPTARIAASASVEAGAFLAAGAVIGPEARIGLGTIVNHNAVVDHDCEIGPYAHIAPSATLGGGVRVGRNVLIGAGAVVLPGLSIGDGATVGAGAVVTRAIGPAETWAGVPARPGEREDQS
jgi:sugar O-acyltransferase (sialic acid O-acetyltransferase NeuD family)